MGGTLVSWFSTWSFPLAATGLLAGLRVTTHWAAADLLAGASPDLEVDPDVLYVDNGQLLTSAGAAAGLDLCLHLIRRDYGSAVAAHAARLSVMPLEREGGQAQFIVQPYPSTTSGSALEPLLETTDHTVERIGAQVGFASAFRDRFKRVTGVSPQSYRRTFRPEPALDFPDRLTRRAQKTKILPMTH
ncbi:hypothetical protein ABZ897_58905 [Nonomuraea sp. NPDC046802]|uniref:GlxA family transcriptional regulator n=1 Tax=Nonomuraea sp. NPDC046802 TaxID=3154919 RepID=UPI003403D219